MKYLTIFVLSIAVLFMAACSGGGVEPTAVPEPTETKPALETAVPTTESYPANQANEPVPVPIDPYPGQDNSAGSDPILDSAYPAEADMADMPSGPGDGTPQEAPQPGVPDEAAAIAQQLSEDLASRLNLDITDVTLVSSAAVEWSDSSLGCPAEGFAYLQVITPGYQIILAANDQQYDYHTDLNGNFVLCQKGRPVTE
ncbi:MAG: hypothetical protein R6X34_20765 [Chloroflexota bacterium]